MQEDFELETILSLITGYNFTNDYNKIYDLVEFVYEEPLIDFEKFNNIKEIVIEHIYRLYPSLRGISYNENINKDIFINFCKLVYGETFTISVLGEKVIKLKPLVKTC